MERPSRKTGDQPATYSTRPNRLPAVPAISRPSMPRASGRFLSVFALVVLCFLVGLGGGLLGARAYNHSYSGTTASARQQYISNEGQLISSIAKDVGPGVVSIDVEDQVSSIDFFGFPRSVTQQSAGTGFIIDPSGIIVTNRHVVPTGTDSVSVTLSDGTRYDNVKVIGRTTDSSSLDVAFLKIDNLRGKKLTVAQLGDSSKMQVGDRVVAIGNALGQFQNTVTTGIISGFGRDVTAGDESGVSQENLTDLFQTDAAINAGNSGGPLVNINSQVIGLNTAVASGAQNIGFAIPINDLKYLINGVLKQGKLQQAYLGVRYISLTDELAGQLNLKIKRGAYLISGQGNGAVVKGSPADKAGLKEKDVITKVNNTQIDDNTNLSTALGKFQVGDTVNLTVLRDGKTQTIMVTLGSAPQS